MTLRLHRLHRADVEGVGQHVGVVDVAVVRPVPVVDPIAAHRQHPGVIDDRVGSDRALVDRARERDHLQHRAGLVEIAGDVVLEERAISVIEVIGVVAWVVGPRDDASSGRSHDQDAAAFGVVRIDAGGENLLRRVLDVGVERQHEI